jgi:hypothetical protein
MKVPCPKCGALINPAKMLGQAGKGKTRVYSEEERELRRHRCAAMRARKATK